MRSFTPLPADYVILPPNSATQQTALVVSNEVYKKLMKLSRSKAHGPDGIPGWVLKENADLLAVQIADILNSSYREGRLPPLWKEADVVPVPKQRPVQDINKHLRPISLTPILSKISEEYVVDTYMSSLLSSQRSTHSNLERCPNPAPRMHQSVWLTLGRSKPMEMDRLRELYSLTSGRHLIWLTIMLWRGSSPPMIVQGRFRAGS